VQFVALAVDADEAALLGDTTRRSVVDVTSEVGLSQCKFSSAPGKHRLERPRREALTSQLRRDHEGDVGLAADSSKLDRPDSFSARATPDREGVASSVVPLLIEAANHVFVVRIGRGPRLLDRPAEEFRRVRVESEPAVRNGVPGQPTVQGEELVQNNARRFTRPCSGAHLRASLASRVALASLHPSRVAGSSATTTQKST